MFLQGHASNVKNVELAARMIARVAKGPKIVVEKSTVRRRGWRWLRMQGVIAHARKPAIAYRALQVPVKTGETLQKVLNAGGGRESRGTSSQQHRVP